MTKFSKRYGHTTAEKPITLREGAPQELREFLIMTVYEFGYEPSWLRRVICKVIKKVPQADNWSEYPNIDRENVALLSDCEWYLVYDVIESLANKIDGKHLETFESELNDYFRANGIGWKLENGQIGTRGDETFEKSVLQVTAVLESAKLQTAHSEMKEAVADLSRRPNADITGAIQHSLACLECVCRETTGDRKATLGELIKRFPGIVPKPLDGAIEKIWGFTSEQGRHLREGNEPNFIEAELVVELTAALATYLGKKLVPTVNKDDLPF
jgi:hypothetical protein